MRGRLRADPDPDPDRDPPRAGPLPLPRGWPRAAARWASDRVRRRAGAATAPPPTWAPGGAVVGPVLLAERGRPLTIAVGSGRGGSGRSTIANGLAAALAIRPGSGPVVLVDADFGAPDQDLRVRGDGHPTLADLLDALPQIAAGDGTVEQYLARDPTSGVRVLLAPPSARYRDEVGTEHLDYVLTYLLAPAFTVVVVDCDRGVPVVGRTGPGSGTGFWLQRADLVLVPFAGDPSGVRATQRYVQACLRWGVAPAAIWPVLNGDRPGLQRDGGLEASIAELARSRLPWAPEPAARALVARRALSLADPAMRAAYARLADAAAGWSARRLAVGG